jgi:hypothetical protein
MSFLKYPDTFQDTPWQIAVNNRDLKLKMEVA